jgi:multidrug efflux pump
MKFTDIFIRRPVLATVISLLILLFGLRAIMELPLRQFPKIENTVITVTTSYPGASAQLMQGFVTTPIEKSVASANGIDYLTSTSQQGLSTVKAYITLNFNPNEAFTNIMSKVESVTNQLPKASEQPVIDKSTGEQFDLMYIGFSSKDMTAEQITDYLTRVVQPQIETVPGVSEAQLLGPMTYAMRIWLNPEKMAAFHVTATDVTNALTQNNYQSAAGSTKGVYVAYPINAETDLHSAQEFKNIIVRSDNGQIIRLKDVAKVQLGSESYDATVSFNNKKATFIGIEATPTANPLTVIAHVRKLLPSMEKNFPPGLKADVVYDSTEYIRASIHEVISTIVEAGIIVILVIFLFLGSIRSVIIPVVTIPLSLIGVASFMLALGYSLNLLTLLAMVLAIGLVVDDAIVVVENIHRHIDEGLSPFKAAIIGAREIAVPVISMSITLAAVYAPIGFMGGMTGALFKEFAFTLASSVILSGVIALTLSPMMCSKLLTSTNKELGLAAKIDAVFEKIKDFYARRLTAVLKYRPVVVLFAVVVLTSCYFLYMNTKKETSPTEDQSVAFIIASGPQNGNINYAELFSKQISDAMKNLPQTKDYFVVNGINLPTDIMAGDIFKTWGDRKLSAMQLQPILQKKLNKIAGLQASVFLPPSLPGNNSGLPVQFVITTTGSYTLLYKMAEKIDKAAMDSGLFAFTQNTLKFDKPELEMHINRAKAADMGITMQQIGDVLAINLGGNYVNRFSMENRSYKVIPQLLRTHRLNPQQLNQIYIKTASGKMIPLSTIMSMKQVVEPNSLTRFQQLNSATIEGVLAPGVTMGQAVAYLQNIANKTLPKGMSYNYAGSSRQYVQQGDALLVALFISILVIFLVLAAQFESFRDPLIILISVPMSICGALIPLNLGMASINIYTEIGLITLVGLISKHGILMTEFANKLQVTDNLNKFEAIIKAAGIRLRAILMTTFSMVFGVVPLIIATGAGAESRYCIGLVIASGMLIGTAFTLFVVPTMYTFLAKDHRAAAKQEEVD